MRNIKKILLIAMLSCYSLQSYSLITFQAGEIAKAEDFNSNFDTLNTKIQHIENNDGYVPAKVNGIDMRVASYRFGSYTIKSNTGYVTSVDVDGFPNSGSLYFGSIDCSGQPYVKTNISQTETLVGTVFKNPNISMRINFTYDGNKVFYDFEDELVKLNYNSLSSRGECRSASNTILAFKAVENDSSITGFSFPLIITGVGTQVTLSREIGMTSTSTLNVFANGLKIGYLRIIPRSSSNPLYVRIDSLESNLSSFNGKPIYLYKDGSYTGLQTSTNEKLYFLSNDCSGNAYAEVLMDFNKYWWDSEKLTNQVIKNNDTYYELSSQIYKISQGAQSYRNYYNSNCNATPTNTKFGYKQAILTTEPTFPIFSLPITVESFSDNIQYIGLPEAF